MFLIAAVLVASCSGLAGAFESELRKDQTRAATPETETQGVSLFQSAQVLSPTVLTDKIWDGAGALAKDNLALESILLEDEPSVDSSECHQTKPELVKEQEVLHTDVLSLDGIADCLSLFQDVVWFGLAFAAFCIWRCFTDMEKKAEELSKPKDATDKGAEQAKAIIRPKARTAPMEVDALVKAMYSENKDDLRKFLDERSVNACDDVCCCTALHVAAHYSCLPAAQALLDRGADANVCDIWDETPLHFAARAGNGEVCALLLKHGADLNASNADGFTPLLAAAKAQKTETCEVLLDHGAHAGGADEDDVPPLLNNILMCRILRGAPAIPEAA